jgi:hypothetical protein
MQDAFEGLPNTVDGIDQLIHEEEAKLECQAEIDPKIVEESVEHISPNVLHFIEILF